MTIQEGRKSWDFNRETVKKEFERGVVDSELIATKHNIPLRTVQRILKQLKEVGSADRRTSPGRPKLLTPSAHQTISRMARKKTSTATSISRRLPTFNKPAVSERTVRRALKEMSYVYAVPKSVPLMTKAQVQKRLQWARRHLHDSKKSLGRNDLRGREDVRAPQEHPRFLDEKKPPSEPRQGRSQTLAKTPSLGRHQF